MPPPNDLPDEPLILALETLGPDWSKALGLVRLVLDTHPPSLVWNRLTHLIVLADVRRVAPGLEMLGLEDVIAVNGELLGAGAEWVLEHAHRFAITGPDDVLSGLARLRSHMGWLRAIVTEAPAFGPPNRTKVVGRKSRYHSQDELAAALLRLDPTANSNEPKK